jgi:hypothetical protein
MERKLKIISADERMAQNQGVKALVLGPAGIGKTTLLRTLDTSRTLFLDMEAGDLAVQDVEVDTMQPETWEECRDLACYLGGPNQNVPPDACYSLAHYNSIAESMGGADALNKYNTYFIDSITVASRLCYRWAEQQPESFNERGKKDPWGTYGLLGREMINWLTHLQHTRDKNIIFVGILERNVDKFNIVHWELQVEGSKTGRELPGIVDQIATMNFHDFGDGILQRVLVCQTLNPYGYPAKDRSGRLDLYEEPHLGKWLHKLTTKATRNPIDHTISRSETLPRGSTREEANKPHPYAISKPQAAE